MSEFNLTNRPIQNPGEDRLDFQVYVKAFHDFLVDAPSPLMTALRGPPGSGRSSFFNMCSWLLEYDQGTARCQPTITIDASRLSFSERSDHFAGLLAQIVAERLLELPKRLDESGRASTDAEDSSRDSSADASGEYADLGVDTLQNPMPAIGEEEGKKLAKLQELKRSEHPAAEISAILPEVIDELTNRLECNDIYVFIDELDGLTRDQSRILLSFAGTALNVRGCKLVLALDERQGPIEPSASSGDRKGAEADIQAHVDAFFEMPRATQIGDFVASLAEQSGVVSYKIGKTEREFYTEISCASIGCTPGAVKRAVREMLLMHRIYAEFEAETHESSTMRDRHVLYALACMRSAWPALYRYFRENPELETFLEFDVEQYVQKHLGEREAAAGYGDADNFRSDLSRFFTALLGKPDDDERDKKLKELKSVLPAWAHAHGRRPLDR